jgi:hypothetical protein
MAWNRRFRSPIVLGDGHYLETVRDAAEFALFLPATSKNSGEWDLVLDLSWRAARDDATNSDIDALKERVVIALKAEGLI